MNRSILETVVGLALMAVLTVALYGAWGAGAGTNGDDEGIRLFARFDYIGDLSPGSDVKIAGIKVGTVVDAVFDPGSRQVTVRLVLDPRYTAPTDSRATIVADGLIGGAHIQIDRGQSDRMLADRGVIRDTRDSLNIAGLVGEIIFRGLTAEQAGGGDAPTVLDGF